ncbi:hypothetical protein [Agrobacterium vitis]|uniref:hypothetical protein n=1 Tax=Agrobacterium vitis TaxID=373 RepID=UPI001F422AF1|nr:hypothetical protein [Agrobacterium vitis]
MRERDQAAVFGVDDDPVPERIGKIRNEADAARWLAFTPHVACLSRKTPWDRLQQPQSVLLKDDQSWGAFDGFARHLKRQHDVDRKMGDNLLQAFGDCKQTRHTGLLSGSFWI